MDIVVPLTLNMIADEKNFSPLGHAVFVVFMCVGLWCHASAA